MHSTNFPIIEIFNKPMLLGNRGRRIKSKKIPIKLNKQLLLKVSNLREWKTVKIIYYIPVLNYASTKLTFPNIKTHKSLNSLSQERTNHTNTMLRLLVALYGNFCYTWTPIYTFAYHWTVQVKRYCQLSTQPNPTLISDS